MLTLYCRNLRQIQIGFGNHKSIEFIFLLCFPSKSCWATPPSLRLIAVRALFKWKTVALRHHGGLPSPPLLSVSSSFLTNRKVPHLVMMMMMMSRGATSFSFSLPPLADGSRSFAACFDYSASGRESLAPVPRHPTRQLSPVSA